jgi:hypothetical protein
MRNWFDDFMIDSVKVLICIFYQIRKLRGMDKMKVEWLG